MQEIPTQAPPSHPLPILPPPPLILNRNPRPLLPNTPPRILITPPTPTPLPTPTPIPIIMVALTRRRLDISIMIVPRLRAMLSLAPVLPLAVHILAPIRAARPARYARTRRHLNVVRGAVMRGRRSRHGYGCGRGLHEDGDGLRRGYGERFGRGHCDVRGRVACDVALGRARRLVHDVGARVAALRGV